MSHRRRTRSLRRLPAIGSGPRTALTVAAALVLPWLARGGDILRGGATAGRSRTGSSATASPNATVVDAARADARDTLARTSQTVQAMQALQKSARDLAARSGAGRNVPNGLAAGGLKPVTGATAGSALWTGAALPTQTTAGGQTNVTVVQSKPQAVLNWETFNIGRQTTLRFDQSKGGKAEKQWVAINKITDPTGAPSQILGNLEAGGQVYVLNQNGILFGATAQVNTHTLVASSLPLNDNLLSRGFLNNPDAQFLFSSLPIPALTSNATMPAYTPPAAPAGKTGDVVVEKGAVLSAPTSAEKVGGRVALVGANVRNEGTISTPDGQTILAAGLQVGLTAHDTTDPSLRGLDVYVGKVRATETDPLTAGTATNAGFIDAPRANVTMAGRNVNQLGVVSSSTSVSLNGRIDLQASYNTTSPVVLGKARFAPGTTGVVTLGAGSVTTILPELTSEETIAASKLPLPSQINLQGRSIYLGTNAQVLAPNASVSLTAGNYVPYNGATRLIASSGQIYLDRGASVNVAGTPDVMAALTQNILTLELRGSELADSPTQRDGVLRGLTLTLDARLTGAYNGLNWTGTPLGDASGFLNLIERNVAQLTTNGGSVSMTAGSSVVMNPGSVVNVSGGWTNFQGGFVETTRVLSDGRVYDLSNATPDRVYSGIYRAESTRLFAKWGITETFAQPLGLTGRHWENGYTQGGQAGQIAITAPGMALDGTLLGQAVSGERQREVPATAGSLSLTFSAEDATHPLLLPFSPTPPNITFGNGPLVAADAFSVGEEGTAAALRADRRAEVVLSPTLLAENGFSTLTVVNPDGNITLPQGVSLSAAPGGSLTLSAANLEIGGEITVPGGKIALTAYNISPATFARLKAQTTPVPVTPAVNTGRGTVEIAAGATLSTAGLVLDERTATSSLPLALGGGEIDLQGYRVALAPGSTLDVSGGVRLDERGRTTYGTAGRIGLKAGQDVNVLSVMGGTLELGGELRGFAGNAGGGALALQAPSFQVGGGAAAPGTLRLGTDFFSTGGFASFTLTGLGAATGGAEQFTPGVRLSAGTELAPVAQSWLARPHAAEEGGVEMVATTLPEGVRAPVSLRFSSPGVVDTFSGARLVRGDVMLAEGASIRTDARASVALQGNTVTVLGSILAPAGQISVAGALSSVGLYADETHAFSTVYLGPQARLSAAGTTLAQENVFGQRVGQVLNGGSISVAGNVLARMGAVLDVSGSSGTLDFLPTQVGSVQPVQGELNGRTVAQSTYGLNSRPMGQTRVAQRVDSDGGTITLQGGQSLQSDATLLGRAGGAEGTGGTLQILSGRFYAPAGGVAPSPLDVTLQVQQAGLLAGGSTGVGALLPGYGQWTAGGFAGSGFDALALGGTVQFTGAVDLAARASLAVADAGVLYADSRVRLTAPYVKLGTNFLTPVTPEQEQPPFTEGGVALHLQPTTGRGQLIVQARNLDVGNLSLQGISRASLTAAGGDLRGAGTLDIAGDLSLTAAQIYPPTALSFTISATAKNVAIANANSGSTTVTLASAVLPPGFGPGSPLLGSTVAAINGTTVTLASGADTSIGSRTLVTYAPESGSVRIQGSGTAALPLSAGGELNIYAANILQGGTLVAPFGQINLGWDGTGTAPVDAITGKSVAVARQVTLAPGSRTSVSAIDPVSGEALVIPYGVNLNDLSWIDPRGVDITGGGAPEKAITVSGVKVDSQAGSVLDVRAGGDLYAYRWVKGLGGSRDLLAGTGSFAILPGYSSTLLPYAPNNPAGTALGGDAGYVNSTLKVGDQVTLGASEGLAAGTYTLLPARYALLPGAVLITPQSGAAVGSFALADGSSLVSGYRAHTLNAGHSGDGLNVRFEVLPGETLRQRAEYRDFLANSFLAEGAQRLGTTLARVPGDAGHLILQATEAMQLAGRVTAQANGTLRGGLVDIASPGQIVINDGQAVSGALTLQAAQLNRFGAESLLIGGIRTSTAAGTAVTVKSSQILVDNAGSPLQGAEIILAARDGLTLTEGSAILQSGTVQGGAETLLLGSATAGSGDGVLLRVSSDPGAQTVRTGRSASPTPNLLVGADVRLAGNSLTLDSTAGLTIDPTAALTGEAVSLRSGRIAVGLEGAAGLPTGQSLVLAGELLQELSGSRRLSLVSYSSIDLYGSGTLGVRGALELHAGALAGYPTAGGTFTIAANSLLLDNAAGGVAPTVAGPLAGELRLRAGALRLGTGTLRVEQYQTVDVQTTGGLVVQGNGGLSAEGDLAFTTPFVTATRAATQSLTAGGALEILAPAGGAGVPAAAGLGASLTLQGASVLAASRLELPSGQITLHATTGDVVVSGALNVAGTAQHFFDLTRYTSPGAVTLQADTGGVEVTGAGSVNVSAAGRGTAGSIRVGAPGGDFVLAGTLRGTGGGSFSLDAATLPTLEALSPALAAGGFSREQSFRVRTGNVVLNGTTVAQSFNLSADAGSVTVLGTIDASGERGGRIALAAGGGLTLGSGAKLSVAAEEFDAAGKGGAISLATRGLGGAELNVQSGATLDLSVAAQTAQSAAQGQFGGTLSLRAPQTAAGTDLLLGTLAGDILGASKVTVEGYRVFDLTGSGLITTAVQESVFSNGQLFTGGTTEARLLAGNSSLAGTLLVTPGAELINRTGNLTLGTSNSTTSSDWNLATYRFGAKKVAGELTLRAAGNLVFFNSLSDGFTTGAYTSALLANNPLLAANAQSWSYQLTAGADLTAADTARVLPLGTLGTGVGSLLLGKNAGTASSTLPGLNATTAAVVGNRFQVIRTGSGDISIAAGRDIQLLNTFATIYTAGTQVADPTMGGTFDLPRLIPNPAAGTGVLGAAQQGTPYPAQFTLAGGNVSLTAQGDIAHYTRNSSGLLVADSSRELPLNWLYRRGYVDQATGAFGVAGGPGRAGEIASTAWWVDFSNFFQGVGALGGGNVSLLAGNDIANVDAVIPTNARMARGTPAAEKLVELGGGDLTVTAGRDLDAGVYYVERGHGALTAGGSIKTNSTRSPSLTNLNSSLPLAAETWLPTTLFAGQSTFDVNARGNVLLGPTANTFLLPAGYNNTVWYKTYFSTYGAESGVNVSSLAGDVTLRESASVAGNSPQPLLQVWLQEVLAVKNTSASWYQPWLRLSETSPDPFTTAASLAPGTLRATAFSGDLRVVGSLTLSPSATGTVELVAAGSLQGLNANGRNLIAGSNLTTWGAATINLSDASPALVPGAASPFAYQTLVGTVPGLALTTGTTFLASFDALFNESGAIRGPEVTLSSKQNLHAPGPLHAGDPSPVRLLAGSGDISGVTLYAGKAAEIMAGRDITDIGFYVQNVSADDSTLVSAGRDLVAYNANTPDRVRARSAGNILNVGEVAAAGDLQIAGPGSLFVLAGRNLDLGIGPVNTDGTGVGIATVGNAHNPALGFDGASVVAAAGLGSGLTAMTTSLDDGTLTEFFETLREAGRAGTYEEGTAAIEKLFGASVGATGDLLLTSRAIKTQSGGSISLLAPNGGVTVGFDVAGAQATDQGILTEAGGDIRIFTDGNVDVGTSRIFTLRGGDIIIWASTGDIAAGAAAKTVASAPPTRVIIDPQSADVATDLAGLATGGGIGVLATVANVAPGDVDLIAPKGTIDAGDAGIRSEGNLNLAATTVLNANNIQVSGTSTGAATAPAVSTPNLGALTAATTTVGAATQAANQLTQPTAGKPKEEEETPSLVTVEVLGYGGG